MWDFENLTLTSDFSEALAFSNAKADAQAEVDDRIVDDELSELQSMLESEGFSFRWAMETGKDLALHLDRNGRRFHGVIVLRKNAISSNLLRTVAKFVEVRSDTQVVIVNGCNSIGEEPDEEVTDFWICLVAGGGIFFSEDSEPIELCRLERTDPKVP